MKASDSTNSLSELNPTNPPDKSCFICLGSDTEPGDPLVDSQLLRNCGCKFAVHPDCWNEWMKEKSDYDCPICRKDSMLRIKIPPNPVLSIDYQEPVQQSRCNVWKVATCLTTTSLTALLVTAIIKWG